MINKADGGGIRGYSSLLILREIMIAIGEIEKELDARTESSFHPFPYRPCHNRTWSGKSKRGGAGTTRNTEQNGASEPASMENSALMASGNNRSSPERVVDGDVSKPCKFLPCHYWDYIGGTSTG
jgi:hypothetical protein